MKYVLFIAACSVAVFFWQYHNFTPIEPNVIGTGNVQYDGKSGTWFVVIDSTQYTVKSVIVRKQFLSLSLDVGIRPTNGMLVTVFTSPQTDGNQVIKGKKSAQDIHCIPPYLSVHLVITLLTLLLCGICIAKIDYARREEEKFDEYVLRKPE